MNSVVLPAPGRPTIPASSATAAALRAEADAALARVALDERDHPHDRGVAAVLGLERDGLGRALRERATRARRRSPGSRARSATGRCGTRSRSGRARRQPRATSSASTPPVACGWTNAISRPMQARAAGCSSISSAPPAASRSSSARDVVDLEGDVVHARARAGRGTGRPACRARARRAARSGRRRPASARSRRPGPRRSREARARRRRGGCRCRSPRRDRRRRRRDDGCRSSSTAPMLPTRLADRAPSVQESGRCAPRSRAGSRSWPCSLAGCGAARKARPTTGSPSMTPQQILVADEEGGRGRDERPHRRRAARTGGSSLALDLQLVEGQGRRRARRSRRPLVRHRPDRRQGSTSRASKAFLEPATPAAAAPLFDGKWFVVSATTAELRDLRAARPTSSAHEPDRSPRPAR